MLFPQFCWTSENLRFSLSLLLTLGIFFRMELWVANFFGKGTNLVCKE